MPAWMSALSPLSLPIAALARNSASAAAGHDAFLDGRLGCVHRVVDAVLLLLDLDLGRAAGRG